MTNKKQNTVPRAVFKFKAVFLLKHGSSASETHGGGEGSKDRISLPADREHCLKLCSVFSPMPVSVEAFSLLRVRILYV